MRSHEFDAMGTHPWVKDTWEPMGAHGRFHMHAWAQDPWAPMGAPMRARPRDVKF